MSSRRQRWLLVEGIDDEHVLKHLCGQRGVGKLDEIKPQGSVEQLLENFPVRLKESEIEILGVVLDADTDLEGRWDALKHRLKQAGYGGVPDHPAANGTILDPHRTRCFPVSAFGSCRTISPRESWRISFAFSSPPAVACSSTSNPAWRASRKRIGVLAN